MKKSILFVSIVLLVMICTACAAASSEVSDLVSTAGGAGAQGDRAQAQEYGSGSQVNNQGGSQPSGQDSQGPGFGGEMPQAMTLALVTFKLEETAYPVDAEQAAEMLVLWKAARSLSENDTTAEQELDAVVNQIQDVFSSNQQAQIEQMDLSFQDMQAVAEQMGIEFGFGGRFDDLTPEQQATIEAARESGQFPRGGPGGDFPGGGQGGGPGGGPGGAGLSPEQRETAIAERGGFQGVNLGLPTPILEAVIAFLETKTQ